MAVGRNHCGAGFPDWGAPNNFREGPSRKVIDVCVYSVKSCELTGDLIPLVFSKRDNGAKVWWIRVVFP